MTLTKMNRTFNPGLSTLRLFMALMGVLAISGCTGKGSTELLGDVGLSLVIELGDNQVTTPNQAYTQPITVRVTGTSNATGIANVPVYFENMSNTLAVNIVTPTVISDSSGLARTTVVAPNTSNATLLIRARTDDGQSITFHLKTRSFPDTPLLGMQDPLTLSTSYTQQASVSVTITSGATVTKWCLSETQTTRPADGSASCGGGAGNSNGWFTSLPTSTTLTATNGAKTMFVWVADQFDQVNLFPSSSTIFLDTSAPGTPIVILRDQGTGSVTDTGNAVTNLEIGNDGDGNFWCVKNALDSAPVPSAPTRGDSCWVSSEPTNITFSSLGLNRVYVWTKDLAQNISANYGTQVINYTTPAVGDPAMVIKDPTTNSIVYARQSTVAVTITSDPTASKWCLSELQTTQPAQGTTPCVGGTGPFNGWLGSRPTSYTFSGGDGSKTVYLWVANPLNNTSAGNITGTITIDTTAPAIPIVDLTDPNTNQPNFTNQSTVNLTITGDTDAVKWCKFERSSVAAPPALPAFNDACFVSVRPTTVSLGAVGSRRVYVYTQDVAMNVAPAPAVGFISYTTTPPNDPVLVMRDTTTNLTNLARDEVVSASINSPAGTIQWCISQTQNTRPANGSAVCNGGTGPANGWLTSLPTSFTLSAGDGLKTVYVWVANSANNVNASVSSASITLDKTLPATPTVVMSDPNSHNTSFTNQVIVTLAITGDTDASRWCRVLQSSTDPVPATPSLTDVCWVLSRPTTIIMDATGDRALYVFTRDAAGNISNAGSSTINYSIDPPADPSVTLADAVTGLTDFARQSSMMLGISADVGAVKWCVSETQTSRPALGSSTCVGGNGPTSGWFTVKPTTFSISSGDATKRVYVWTANVNNTINANPSSASIARDGTLPGTPTVTLNDPNTGSATNTNQNLVTMTIGGEDADVTAWCALEQASVAAAPAAPIFSHACFNTSKPNTLALSGTANRRVYVYLRDRAYNVSAAPAIANINYSVTPPSTPALSLTDVTTASTTYTRLATVTTAITSDGGATKWCLSETQTTAPSLGTSNCAGGQGTTNGWFVTRPTSMVVSSGDGLKTIYLWTADSANNVSSAIVTDTITMDTQLPSVPFLTLSDPNTSSTSLTNQATVDMSVQFDTDAVAWCSFEQAVATGAPSAPLYNNGCWTGTRPTTRALGATGVRRVYLFTKDVAGNVSPAPATAQINYSTTPPTDPILVLSNTTTGSTTITKVTGVGVSITSPSGTVKWCLSETQTTKPATGSVACAGGAGPTSGWYTSLPSAFTLSTGDVAKTVYIWVADASNNVNANASTASITLDTLVPATPTVTLTDPNTTSAVQTNQLVVNLNITSDTDAVKWCRVLQADVDPAPSTPSVSDSCWSSSRPTSQIIDATGTRKLYVFTQDTATNVGVAGTAQITYSTTAPADPTVALADAVTSLSDFSKQTSLSLSITGDTDAVKWCVSETQTTRPALGTTTCAGGNGPSAGWHTTRPSSFSTSSGDGNKRVYVWTANIYNTVNSNSSSAIITLDTGSPSVPSVTMYDPNTNSSTATNQATVNITIGADADALAWCPIEQAAAAAAPSAPAFGNGCFVTTKPTTQSLAATGSRRVYVFTRDRAYNVSSSGGIANMSYSTAAPITPTLALSDPTTASVAYARQVAITVAVTGDTGATKWCLSETQTTQPALGTSACNGGTGAANGWLTVRPTTFTLSSGDNLKTVYLWTADVANTTSSSASTDTITLDTVTPAIPTVSLSDSNTGSTAFTNLSSANLSIVNDTDATAWCSIEQASATAAPTAPLHNNACWVGSRPTTQTLGTTGDRRVFIYTRDVARNVSLAPALASITYSTSAPTDPVLVLSNSVTGSRLYTNDRTVAVAINNPIGAVKWCISETQPTRPSNGTTTCVGGAGPSSGWYSTMPSTLQLSSGDNLKTVYIWVADGSNNTNANSSSTTITLKEAAPSAPTVALSDPNTSSTSITNQNTVNLSITSDSDATAWCSVSQDAAIAAPSTPSVSSTCWVLTRPTSVILGAVGSRKVYVFLRDAAMNISSPGSASIDLSTTSPTDPTLALAHATTGLSTFAKTTALNITIASDATATRWCVSETQSVRPALGTSTCVGGSGGSNGWSTTRPTTFTLSSTDANKRVYVWIANAGNNVNDNAVSQAIVLDTAPPGAFTVTGVTGGTDLTSDAVLGTTTVPTLNWAASSTAAEYHVAVYNAANTVVVCAQATTAATAYTFAGCNLTDGVSYTARLESVDEAQNLRLATNTNFAFSVNLTPPGAFSITGASGSQDTIIDQWSGTSLPTVSWGSSSGANQYLVRVLANDGVTVMCPSQTKSGVQQDHEYSTTGCTSLINNTLYQIEVSSKNVAGNSTAASNNYFIFRTDLTAPTLSLTATPALQSITPVANFGFSAADTISGVASVQCKRDTGLYAACDTTSTQGYAGLSDIHHSFTVKVTDTVGFTATQPYAWDIDAVLPTAFTISGATGPTDSVVDNELRNDNKITANWTDSSNEDYYEVTILNTDDSVACATVTKAQNSTSHYFSSCTLNVANDYKIAVVAKRGFGTSYTPTPMLINTISDTATATITATPTSVSSGSNVTVTLTAYQDGVAMTTGGINPAFAIGGGVSSGTFGSVTDLGNGKYRVIFTGTTAGSGSVISATTSYLGGFTSVGTATVTVVPGSVSASVSSVSVSSATVQSDNIQLVTITANVRDASSNAISAITVTGAHSGGTSVGVFSSFVESPASSGNYQGTFSGRVVGSATQMNITAAGTMLNGHPTVTVLPGPPKKIATTGSVTISTHQCAGPYNVTLRDHWGNLASAQSNVQVDFSGIGSGNFSLNGDCSSPVTNTSIFLGGSTAAPVYAIPRAPASAAVFNFADHDSNLTTGALTVAINGKLAWIGTTGQLAWRATSGYPSRSSLDGMQDPRAVWVNTSTNLMYVVDSGNHRIVRFDVGSQTITGWVGRVDSVEGMSCPGYAVPATGASTPAWCLGGSSQISSGTNLDGMMNNPAEITGDGTYLYVFDTNNHRIMRYEESTGIFKGWYGRISTVTGMSCVSGSPTVNQATPNWCYGGVSSSTTGTNWDGMFNFSTNGSLRAFYDATALSNLLLVLDNNNNRLVRLKIDNTNVSFEGWAGRSGTATLVNGANTATCGAVTIGGATPGWCKGGVSQASGALSIPANPDYNNMFNSVRGLAVQPGSPAYAYFFDLSNGRVVQFDVTGGTTYQWTGRATNHYPATGGANCNTYNNDTGWCQGGVPIYNGYCYPTCGGANTANRNTIASNGLMLAVDSSYLYMGYNPSGTGAIYRMPLSTAMGNSATIGFIGRLNSTPTSGANCSTTPLGFTTPNWCFGGGSRSGVTDGQFNTPLGMFADTSNGVLYTTDRVLNKVQVNNLSTGTAMGWIGAKANSSPTSWLTTYVAGLLGNIAYTGEDLSFAAGYNNGNAIVGAGGASNDGTNLYIADTSNHRIKRYSIANGNYAGWYGRVNAVPTGIDDACTSIGSGGLTPTWCYGGSSQAAATQGTGELNSPRGMAFDSSYLYIADSGLHRIVRLSRTNASFAGWMGRNNTSPPGTMTGFDATGNTRCPTVGALTVTGAWCAAGTHVNSTAGDGSMNGPRDITADATNGYLFVADTGNSRVNMYSTNGTFLGWLGRPNGTPTTAGPTTGQLDSVCNPLTTSQSTPYWCVGGVVQSGNLNTQNFSGFNGPQGVSFENGNLYVADTNNHKIHKFVSTTGAYLGWIGRSGTTKPTGVGPTATGTTLAQCTTGLTLGNALPGWCLNGGSQASTTGVYDNAFSSPTAVWSDPNENYLYVVDAGNHRVTKHHKISGAFIGWRGVVGSVPGSGDTGCSTAAVGDVTPGWCIGGTGQSSRKLGGFYNPIAITGDANFIYVTDTFNNRVVALPK